MPWWSWVIIWVALVILALAYLALLGLKLWRHLVALGREASAVSAAASERFASSTATGGVEPAPQALPDPFISPDVARADYRAGKSERKNARRHRRVLRRKAAHQAQSLKDLAGEGIELRR